MAKLLQDGLIKAKNNNFLAPIVKNITLLIGDSRKIIPELVQKNQYSPDIIYLDPMFPTKKKSAAPNKRIQTLQHIINSSSKTDEQPENENIELLKISLIHAKSRVVVKRPRISANLGNIKPNFSLIGKANRFDIYLPREFEKLRIAFI